MKSELLRHWKSLPPRRRKWLGWLGGLLLFYTVFGFLILPLIVKSVAIKQLSSQLDRQVSIRQVRINPYALSATIRGLLVKDKDGEPFLSVEEAHANFQLSSFFGKPWVFKDIWTKKPYCRVQINKDYTFNFSDLLTKFSRPSPKPKKTAKPLFLHIGRFEIAGATASFTDETLSTPFRRLIGPIQIVLTEFHTDPNNKNPYSFTGTTDSGEKLSWSGQFSLDPLQSAGDLALEGLSIPKYSPLFQDLVKFEVKDGIVDGSMSYRFSMAGTNYIAAITNAAFSLRSLKVVEGSNAEALVELDKFAVSEAAADTETRHAEVGQVSLDGGRIMAKRGKDQIINLVQASEPAPRSATNAPGGVLFLMRAATNAFAALVQSTNLWSGKIQRVDVTNCSIHWEDLAAARPVQVGVDAISLAARNLSNMTGSNQTADLSFKWNTNGTVRLGSSVQLAPPAADLALNVSNVELHALGPYLEPFLNLVLIESKVAVDGNFQMRMETNELPKVTFRGDARMDDFATVDAQTHDLLKWKSVQISAMEANLQPPAVAIKQIAITDPYVRVAIETNQTLNFLTLVKNSSTNGPADANQQPIANAPPSSARKAGLGQKLGAIISKALSPATNGTGDAALPRVAVELIAITNGFLQFNDLSVEPPVTTSLQELCGTVSNLSSEELKRADIQLAGKADRTGPIEINGKINPLSQTAPTQLQVVFKDVDLSPTSPYVGKFLGYRLKKGKLNVLVDYEVTQRQLKAKNVVMLDQFTLGEKVQSPDATKLPVKLAVALLKDRNGKIELELPIEGNLDDPQFHFGKIIVHVLGNVMTKIVTSPFAALGSMFGKKGAPDEDFSFQEFAPGSAEIQPANQQKLDALINGLYERPGLELQIEGSFDPAADGNGLRKKKLQQIFRQQKWAGLRKSEQAKVAQDQLPITPEEYRSFIQNAYATQIRTAVTNVSTVASSAPVPAADTALSSPGHGGKGATALLQKSVPIPSAPPDEKEQLVLSSIKISDEDYVQLAKARAQTVQQRILDSGKVETNRLSLGEIAPGPATNHATRVYFHLE